MIASSIGLMIATSVIALTIVSGRMYKSIQAQQRFLRDAKKATETISRQFRYATQDLPVYIMNQGSVPNRGYRVQFSRAGETAIRAFYINPGADNNYDTPWDNTLVYDPNINTSGDEKVIAKYVTTSREGGCFTYMDATSPLEVNIRIGDPVINATAIILRTSNAYTGPGMQGCEVNFYVGPRN